MRQLCPLRRLSHLGRMEAVPLITTTCVLLARECPGRWGHLETTVMDFRPDLEDRDSLI